MCLLAWSHYTYVLSTYVGPEIQSVNEIALKCSMLSSCRANASKSGLGITLTLRKQKYMGGVCFAFGRVFLPSCTLALEADKLYIAHPVVAATFRRG